MIQLKVARKRINDGGLAVGRFVVAAIEWLMFWLRVGWRLFKMGVNSFIRVMVPVVVRLVALTLVLGFPMAIGMFVEWSHLPADWSVYTRLAVGVVWLATVLVIALGVREQRVQSERSAIKRMQ